MAIFVGTTGDDIFTGGDGADSAYGDNGNDSLVGAGGNDLLVGGDGADTLDGGAGEDVLASGFADGQFTGSNFSRGVSYDYGLEVDVLRGGAGDDYIFAGVNDVIDGGASGNYGNRLYITFFGSSTGVQADFRPLKSQNSVTIGTTSISNIQNISYLEGSSYDDLLVPIDTFYPADARVYGRGGNDRIIADYYTGFGDGGLYGGDGDDVIDGRPSQYGARIFGEAGNDTLYASASFGGGVSGGDGDDLIYGGGSLIRGDGGNDTILFNQFASVTALGGEGNDRLDARTTSGALRLFGGDGADTILGGTGNDTLGSADGSFLSGFDTAASILDDYRAEIDVITGGAGDDQIGAGYGDDVDGGEGSDTLFLSLGGSPTGLTVSTEGLTGSGVTFIGTTRVTGVERLGTLRLTNYNDIVNVTTQDTLVTVLGGAGDDTFFSNRSSVAMYGEAGNDRFVSGPAGDIIDGGDGVDTVDYLNATAAMTVRLASGVGGGGDQLTAIENVTGSGFADSLAGDASANRLEGGAGNDTLIGGGGVDTLAGGAGDDTLQVDAVGTIIVEGANEGNDTVIVSALAGSYLLNSGAAVETLSAASGSVAINIGGNEFSQVINGNDGANILSSGGGGGVDTMNGGLGDDIYRVFSTGDVINDTGGFDTVYASGTSYFLYSSAAVEYLSTSEQAGTQGFYMVGNGASQLIVGNWGDNTLNGRGGDGVALPDTLIGLYGNDTYGVFSQGDVVREIAGQGNDVVFASASYQLRAGTEIEVLSAVNQSAGDVGSAYTLRGNEFGQIVAGNNAVNVLDGRDGNDTLVGLGGNDTFAFTTALDGTNNVDTVRDFASGSDKVGLASDVFAAVTDGGIVAGEFVIGTAAADADDRLVYDQATGRLFFDADGNGSGAAVLFAQFGAGTVLAASDFVVVAPVASLPSA